MKWRWRSRMFRLKSLWSIKACVCTCILYFDGIINMEVDFSAICTQLSLSHMVVVTSVHEYLIVPSGMIAVYNVSSCCYCLVWCMFICGLSSFRLPAWCWGDWPYLLHIHWQSSELQLEKIRLQDASSWPCPSPRCEWMSASHQSLSLWAIPVPRRHRSC